MAWPTIAVEFDFTHGPLTALASATWNDRSADVLSFSIKRGRRDELARVEAGTATIVLDNTDRQYNPQGLPQIPAVISGIQPMRKVRISATYGGTTYYLFTGYIESWQTNYTSAGDATVTVQCIDAFKYFSLVKLNGAYVSETTGASIGTWLTVIDWPAADRVIYSTQGTIQAGTFTNVPALTHFRNLEAVENGLFLIDEQGRPMFQGRYLRMNNSFSLVTFDDAPASTTPFLRYTALYDDTYLWNEARITRTGGTEQVASDTTSQAAFFTRTYTATLPLLSDSEAGSLAHYFVSRYATPAFRYTSVTIEGTMVDTLWPQILNLVISNVVTISSWIYDPQGQGVALHNPHTQDCFIEGIAHSVDPATGRWTTTYQLSPVVSAAYWILGNVTYGVLGSTTKLGY